MRFHQTNPYLGALGALAEESSALKTRARMPTRAECKDERGNWSILKDPGCEIYREEAMKDIQAQIAATPYAIPPRYFLPAQEPLPDWIKKKPDFHGAIPKLSRFVSINYHCFFEANGQIVGEAINEDCAVTWGRFHGDDRKGGYEIPPENHHDVLNLLRPYLDKSLASPAAAPSPFITTPTPSVVTKPIPHVPPPTIPLPTKEKGMPTWLILTLVAGAGVGLYILLK